MLDDPVDHAMVETIHRIGHVYRHARRSRNPSKATPILTALRAIGVDYAQGYGIALPEPFVATNVRRAVFGNRR